MKSIENSIEGEHLLPKSLLTEELDQEMAGCLVSTDNKNTKGNNAPNFKLKPDLEDVKDILSIKNEVHMSSSNGYLEDVSDDDFELVIEASSDECGSPMKKVDEDTISAPQIVQEIKDILGIQNGTAETEYELEEKDITTVDCLDSDDIVEEDDIQIVNVNNISKKTDLVFDITPEQKNTKLKTTENKFQEETRTNRANALVKSTPLIIGTARSDVPSNINRVLEAKCDSTQNNSLNFVSDTKRNPTDGNDGKVSAKDLFSDIDKNTPYNDNITLSQLSNLSESSVEWTVIDSVETSDEEKSDQCKQNSSKKEVDLILENQLDNQPNLCNGGVNLPLTENCEGSRKRVACNDASSKQFKKPKLNIDEPNPSEVTIMKRSLSFIDKNEAKRIKSIDGIVQHSGIIVDSSRKNTHSIEDINVSQNVRNEINEAVNDDKQLDRNSKEMSFVGELVVSEEVPLQKCDINEPANSNCLKNKTISSKEDIGVMGSVMNCVEKKSCEIIPENSTVPPKEMEIHDNLDRAISNEESNIKLNETILSNEDKSEYNQKGNICGIPFAAQSDTQQKPLANQNTKSWSTESADIELINKQEMSKLNKEIKSCDIQSQVVNDKQHHSVIINDRSDSSHSGSADIKLTKSKEMFELDQEVVICDMPQDLNYNQHSLINVNSTTGHSHSASAGIELIKKQEMSELDQEDKIQSEDINYKHHSLVNDEPQSSHCDSADIELTKTKEIPELDQEVESVVIPQDLNYNQEHSLIDENSTTEQSLSAGIELITKQDISELDHEDKSCTIESEDINDKHNLLINNESHSRCSDSAYIESIKSKEMPEGEQEVNCVDIPQVLNDKQSHTLVNDKSDTNHCESGDFELIKTQELSELNQENKTFCIPAKASSGSLKQSFFNAKAGGSRNESASIDLISKEETSQLGKKDSCIITSQIINGNQVRSLKNGIAESKLNDSELFELSQIQDTSTLDEEDNSFEIISQILSDSKEQHLNCQEHKCSSLDLINRIETSEPNQAVKNCGITSKEVKDLLKQCPNFLGLSSNNSPIMLNEKRELPIFREKEAIKSSETPPHDLASKEQQITELDKTRLGEHFSNDIINQSKPELIQEEKSSELPSNTLKYNEKQTLTIEEDVIDEIQSNHSNEDQPHIYDLDVSMLDISKDTNETDAINNKYLSREIQNEPKQIELDENNGCYVSTSRSSPFQIVNRSFQKNIKPKSMSNLDLAIESVVEKSRTNTLKSVPLLSKFHKDKLKKMTRLDLEEAVVLKVCEAITDRSDLGQLRLRVQNLEQNNEIWRKKAIQFEKQNRELEMVLKRFLTETAQIKRDNQNKVPLPIKVTRSVGLQVVLASSVNGALVSSKSKFTLDSNINENSYNRLQTNQQQQRHPQLLLPKKSEKEPAKDLQKRIPFSSPLRAQSTINNPTSSKARDRPKQTKNSSASVSPGPSPGASASTSTSTSTTALQANSSASSTPQISSPKMSNLNTTSKSLNTLTPIKNKSTPTKDNMEVIDLTDREDKNKGLPQSQTIDPESNFITQSLRMYHGCNMTRLNPGATVILSIGPLPTEGATSPAMMSPSIRVAPSTQVCFVQQSTGSTPAQPMYALLQKPGRQQFLVATSSANSPLGGLQSRPMMTVTPRPTNTLTALPVYRAGGGQIIPVQTTPVNVRPPNLGNTPVRQVPQAIRIQPQIKVLKHPAPLPSVPQPVLRPGTKAPPPKPTLKIAKTVNGIMLSWSMTLTKDLADMASYQLYAYQEASQPPSTNLWKKVGDVKALPLPMACTLTQFIDGHKYHFAVRAVDIHGRIGPFSHPGSILLTK